MNNTIEKLSQYAQDGMRLKYTPEGESKAKVLWTGLGNRIGLHGYAATITSEKWKKSGGSFLKRLAKIPSGEIVEVFDFQNKTRDRGLWVSFTKVKLGDSI